MNRSAGSYRVLIVDDNAGDLGLFHEAIREVGAPILIVTCQNAQQAITVLATDHAFDLIMSDLNMPGMSGLDLVNRLAQDPALANIPIVLMSSSLPEKLPPRIASRLTVPYFTKAATWTDFLRLANEIHATLRHGTSSSSGRLLAERMTPAVGFPKFV